MIRARRLVRKRDGREVAFDPGKIADSIYRASEAAGRPDRLLAEELASVVALFLEREFPQRVPTIEEVADLVERVLVETGHARTAREFILERDRRRRIRAALRVRSLPDPARGGPSVDARGRGRAAPWSKARIVEALVREAGLSEELAEEVASAVERRVFDSGLRRVSTAVVRALVDNELFERGFEDHIERQSVLGVPRFDLERLVGAGGGHEDLSREIADRVWRQYALLAVHGGGEDSTASLHAAGALHLGGLEAPLLFESVTVSVPSDRTDEQSEEALRRLVGDAAAVAREVAVPLPEEPARRRRGRREERIERLAQDLADAARGRPVRILFGPPGPGALNDAAAWIRLAARSAGALRVEFHLSDLVRWPRRVVEQAALEAGEEGVVDVRLRGRRPMHAAVLMTVDVNCARAAFESARFDAGDFAERLGRLVDRALEAGGQRRRLLAGRAEAGQAEVRVRLQALDAAWCVLADQRPGEDLNALESLRQTVAALRTRLERSEHGPARLAIGPAAEIGARFGEIDRRLFERGAKIHGLPVEGMRYRYLSWPDLGSGGVDPRMAAEVLALCASPFDEATLPVLHAEVRERVHLWRELARVPGGDANACS